MASTNQKILMGCITTTVILIQYFMKDPRVQMFLRMMKVLFAVKRMGWMNKGPYSYADVFETKVDENPKAVKFTVVETGETYTMEELDAMANKVARWGQKQNLAQKETVSLMMLNHPHYVSIWLGLAKIGVTTALINTNLSGKPLIHSVELALKNVTNKIAIFDAALQAQISNDVPKLEELGIKVLFWNHEVEGDKGNMRYTVSQESPERVSKSCRSNIKMIDPVIYIYTSGTTGMPKACRISHSRYSLAALPYQYLCDLTPEDNIYLCLPLYHSAAGIIAFSTSINSGASVVLRKKFSASNFTHDCLKYNVTSFQHIGELCRYLEAAPPNEQDRNLKIRTAFGNGLRPDCWENFRTRYNISKIVEFYGATEANIALFNSTGKVGALGYIPRIFDFVYPLKLIKTDPADPGTPLLDSKGHCILCDVGEVGLLINAIATKGVKGRFDGYTDEKATNSKILRNVFKEGDTYFNSGDLMTRDAEGFYYWSDRTGDTFRWKGENVATTEVTNILASVAGVDDVAVYGVSLPGCEGRAGMAAIVGKNYERSTLFADTGGVDVEEIRKQCKADLPVYAHPLFLRFKKKGTVLETTSTFKHLKAPLIKDSFDPAAMDGDLLFYATKEGYKPLTPDIYKQIQDSKLKF